jgi:hypothetical protein
MISRLTLDVAIHDIIFLRSLHPINHSASSPSPEQPRLPQIHHHKYVLSRSPILALPSITFLAHELTISVSSTISIAPIALHQHLLPSKLDHISSATINTSAHNLTQHLSYLNKLPKGRAYSQELFNIVVPSTYQSIARFTTSFDHCLRLYKPSTLAFCPKLPTRCLSYVSHGISSKALLSHGRFTLTNPQSERLALERKEATRRRNLCRSTYQANVTTNGIRKSAAPTIVHLAARARLSKSRVLSASLRRHATQPTPRTSQWTTLHSFRSSWPLLPPLHQRNLPNALSTSATPRSPPSLPSPPASRSSRMPTPSHSAARRRRSLRLQRRSSAALPSSLRSPTSLPSGASFCGSGLLGFCGFLQVLW